MRTIIIEDEEPGRIIIRSFVSERDDIEIVGEAKDGFEGMKLINELKPDLIFLDIQMPKLTGFEMLELLGNNHPQIIFTTAFDEFAIKAFELNAVDYLLKPFSKDRLNQAIDRAIERKNKKEGIPLKQINQLNDFINTNKSIERIMVKERDKIVVIPVDDIYYIEAQDDYVMVYTKDEEHLKEKTMKTLEEQLDKNKFIRIHRSYIANITQIDKIQLYEKESYMVIMTNGAKIRASKAGYKRLKEVL
ncbi:MAG: LytTR family transcriptional regulator DNA-binding domain-containing protein [Bacteroidota bacterium]